MSVTELNLLKFVCPHCGQHIACNPAYAGRPMLCPACQQALQIPLLQPAAAITSAVAETAQTEPLTVGTLDIEAPAEASGDELASDDTSSEPEGFFTLGWQIRHAAVYAAILFYVGLLAGWQPAWQFIAPSNVKILIGLGEDFDRLNATDKLLRINQRVFGGADSDGHRGNTICFRIVPNEAMWLLVGGAVCSGLGMARSGYWFSRSTNPRRRFSIDLCELAERNRAFRLVYLWLSLAIIIFFFGLIPVCLLVPHCFAGTLAAFAHR